MICRREVRHTGFTEDLWREVRHTGFTEDLCEGDEAGRMGRGSVGGR